MKNKLLILLLAIIVTFSGCTQKQPQTSEKTSSQKVEKKAAEKSPDVIADGFHKLVSEGKKPYELLQYVDENIASQNQKQATKMIEELLRIQTASLDEYENRLYTESNISAFINYFPGTFDSSKVKEIKEEDLKKLIDEILRGGYCFIMVEGSPTIVIDYEKLKKYKDEVTIELGNYIDIQTDEIDNPSIMDMGFVIPLDEVARRIAQAEKYYKNYSDSSRSQEIAEINQSMISLYLRGLDNSPVFDYQTNKMHLENMKSYKNTIEKYKGTVFAEIVKEYYKINEKHKFNRSDEALKYSDTSKLLNDYTKYVKQGLPK